MGKKTISDTIVETHFEHVSKQLVVQQGESIIRLTAEQITALKSVVNGEVGMYCSKTIPTNKFKLLKNFNVLVECPQTGAILLLRNDDQRNDSKNIFDVAETLKGKIARDRDLKNK